MVKWTAVTADLSVHSGNTDDRSWYELSEVLGFMANTKSRIVSLRIDGPTGSATIDSDKDGYIIGNKVIASLQGGQQITLVGIGYWDKPADVGRIKWYNADTMELQFTEARPTEQCGFFLIQNP